MSLIAVFVAGFCLGMVAASWWDDWMERDIGRLEQKRATWREVERDDRWVTIEVTRPDGGTHRVRVPAKPLPFPDREP